MKKIAIVITALLSGHLLFAQDLNDFEGRKFEQMGTMLPTPNVYRTADGSPGPQYWQQKADYEIEVELDDNNQSISGHETISYHNNAPIALNYLWVQLEQNVRNKNSDTYSTFTSKMDAISSDKARKVLGGNEDLGFQIIEVKDEQGNDLPFTINNTMMRVDPPVEIGSGETYKLSIKWYYNINDRGVDRARSGYEYFPEDGNYLYTIAQFFPRMAVYNDVEGWQNKQFLGRGEFTLPFGDYHVKMTVPADHLVGATGVLQNPEEVLTQQQREALKRAKTANEPVVIVSEQEAVENEQSNSNEKKTWIFKAENVRDFAWTSSRKFIWDAMGVDIDGRNVMAMSYYPKEANPLYGEFSTRVVAHTLKTYSSFTIPYPYPKAISVEADNGMEYPMICFNYGRPDKNGEYSDQLKYGMISVIIHEVGHNFFPMIVNSDERQWTWMDEGLNSFVQYLTEQAWEDDYPSRRGPIKKIIPYMQGSPQAMVPIMTNSEQVKQFGNNAYGKPATALNVLRKTVMGEELFDFAFKQYASKWAFKHPTPADLFRTMEDASAVDLDWFWKGWFYTTDPVDISIDDITWYKYQDKESKKQSKFEASSESEKLETPRPINAMMGKITGFADPEENYYELKFSNKGGLVMPVIVKLNYKNGTSETRKFPAEIWRQNEKVIYKILVLDNELASVEIDPDEITADIDKNNNYFPREEVKSRFDKFKESKKHNQNTNN